MKNKKAELIEKWLKEGTDDAKNIIDLPWKLDISEDSEGNISIAAYISGGRLQYHSAAY